MYTLTGKIAYYNTWCLAWFPSDLGKYYRSLLPKAWGVKPPMNPPHVSIVRVFETPDRKRWGEFEGQELDITICDGVETDGTYYWLDCFSDEVGYIRRRLGLSTFRQAYASYHITIGNVK